MTHFNTCIVLSVLLAFVGICQCQNKCFYHPGLSGTKCLNTASSTYTCCPPDHRCDNGQCLADGDKKSDDPSVYTLVMIGVAVTVFGLIAIIGGIVYRHQRRIATTGKTSGTFSEFFDSPRREISVGYRVRSSTSQTQTPEIHQEMPKSNP